MHTLLLREGPFHLIWLKFSDLGWMGGAPNEKQIDEESETEAKEQTNLDAQEQLHFDWFMIL